MSEFSPYLSNLNQREAPRAVDRFDQQRDLSSRMANRWKRFLERKRKGVNRLSRRSWMRGAFFRRGGNTASHLQAEIEESTIDMRRYVLMAQYAINLAVQHDPNMNRRLAKKRQLMDKWRNMHQRVSLS